MSLLGLKNKETTTAVEQDDTKQSVNVAGIETVENLDGKLTFYLSGKIDASNSEAIQDFAFKEIDENELSEIVFDMNDVTYVSSAGLRMFSAANQKSIEYNIEYRLINMRQDIQKMFQMTGYASAFSIETK